MVLNVLKNPAFAIILSVLATVIVALAAVGFNASESSDSPGSSGDLGSSTDGAYKAERVRVPATAAPATEQQMEDILSSLWLPVPDVEKKPIGFDYVEEWRSYAVGGGLCNGFGVQIKPDPSNGTFEPIEGMTTQRFCSEVYNSYDMEIHNAFAKADTFFVENADTIYVAKARALGTPKGLKLIRVTDAQEG